MMNRRRSAIALLVAVARDVPHDDLVALLDGLAAELEVAERGAAHVGHRALPADDLRHRAVQQAGLARSLS